jgi:hypothetical protein
MMTGKAWWSIRRVDQTPHKSGGEADHPSSFFVFSFPDFVYGLSK